MKTKFTIFILALAIMGCNNKKEGDKATDPSTKSSDTIEEVGVVEDVSIEQKKWKLKTLEGKDIQMAENQDEDLFFMLDPDENRIMGFSGCNTFNGTYTLAEGNRIRFAQMAATLKSCPDIHIDESEFLNVFELADNYTVNNNELSLNVGRRAPLAVFEAVEAE